MYTTVHVPTSSLKQVTSFWFCYSLGYFISKAAENAAREVRCITVVRLQTGSGRLGGSSWALFSDMPIKNSKTCRTAGLEGLIWAQTVHETGWDQCLLPSCLLPALTGDAASASTSNGTWATTCQAVAAWNVLWEPQIRGTTETVSSLFILNVTCSFLWCSGTNLTYRHSKTIRGKATTSTRLNARLNGAIPTKLLGLSCCFTPGPNDVDLCQLENWTHST